MKDLCNHAVETTKYKLISNLKFPFGDKIGNFFFSTVAHFKKSVYKRTKIEFISVLRKGCPKYMCKSC